MKYYLPAIIATTLFAPVDLPAAFDTLVGVIDTAANPTGVATDGTHLFYVTLDGTTSALFDIAAPLTVVVPVGDAGLGSPQGTQIGATSFSTSSRGLQGLAVDSAGNIYTAGDTGNTTTFIDKWVPDGIGGYTADSTFRTNADAALGRISGGMALVSDTLIAIPDFSTTSSTISYIDNTGNVVGSSVAVSDGILREVVFNGTDNVIYPLRNKTGDDRMLDGYVSGVNTTTGGGAYTASALIDDGANNNSAAIQSGYFNSATGQLITVDSKANTTLKRSVRVWDTSASGTALTLAYSIDNDTFAFATNDMDDAVVIGANLFVSASNENVIYVFEEGTSSGVSDWQLLN